MKEFRRNKKISEKFEEGNLDREGNYFDDFNGKDTFFKFMADVVKFFDETNDPKFKFIKGGDGSLKSMETKTAMDLYEKRIAPLMEKMADFGLLKREILDELNDYHEYAAAVLKHCYKNFTDEHVLQSLYNNEFIKMICVTKILSAMAYISLDYHNTDREHWLGLTLEETKKNVRLSGINEPVLSRGGQETEKAVRGDFRSNGKYWQKYNTGRMSLEHYFDNLWTNTIMNCIMMKLTNPGVNDAFNTESPEQKMKFLKGLKQYTLDEMKNNPGA